MPLIEYRVDGTDERIEQIFHSTEEIPDVIVSSSGRTARRLVVPLIARVNWDGDVRQRPRWNRGLGCMTDGERHARQIAKRRGLMHWDELGDETAQRNLLERQQSEQANRSRAEAAELGEYDRNVARFGGDKARAVAETWSAKRILDGNTVFASGGS